MIVFDASALLALLFKEDGHHIVAEHLDESIISTVNLSEVISRFVRDGHPSTIIYHQIQRTPIQIAPFSTVQAVIAAELMPMTRPFGLSLADRACLSLGIEKKLTILTADSVWKQATTAVKIKLIR